jgi:excisionase family DNA binding protein
MQRDDPPEPLVASPKTACRIMGVGPTRLYELLKAGELESYRDGASRKITMRSIKARVDRCLSRAKAEEAKR